MLIDPTVNVVYATHSLLSHFKKINTDPEILKDLAEQVINAVMKYIKAAIAVDAGSSDVMKGLRLHNAKKKLSETVEKVRATKELKGEEILGTLKVSF